jgi:regulator of cell morphogenesis and NO signaling
LTYIKEADAVLAYCIFMMPTAAASPSVDSIETASLEELIAHIDQSHHAFTRDQLNRIANLIAILEGAGTPISSELRHCCSELEADLRPHLMKEEQILFPYILGLEGSPDHPPHACFGTLANPIRMMNIEHDRLDGLLVRLRETTGNYHADPCGQSDLSALFTALEALDADLVRHMYLEDEVLFPRALGLEQELLS